MWAENRDVEAKEEKNMGNKIVSLMQKKRDEFLLKKKENDQAEKEWQEESIRNAKRFIDFVRRKMTKGEEEGVYKEAAGFELKAISPKSWKLTFTFHSVDQPAYLPFDKQKLQDYFQEYYRKLGYTATAEESKGFKSNFLEITISQ